MLKQNESDKIINSFLGSALSQIAGFPDELAFFSPHKGWNNFSRELNLRTTNLVLPFPTANLTALIFAERSHSRYDLGAQSSASQKSNLAPDFFLLNPA